MRISQRTPGPNGRTSRSSSLWERDWRNDRRESSTVGEAGIGEARLERKRLKGPPQKRSGQSGISPELARPNHSDLAMGGGSSEDGNSRLCLPFVAKTTANKTEQKN